jgi:transaldolase
MPDTANSASHLAQLRDMTVIVADTGDIEAIRKAKPIDATTNPSLILKAAKVEAYAPLIAEAIAATERTGKTEAQVIDDAIDRIAVRIGTEILSIIPGRVSVEVDARLSYDADAIVAKAHKLIGLFADAGIGPDRVLIKTAATWEGIRAAETLEKAGINCNITLLFAFAQARASAEAGAFLISPFVGRILDWFKKANPDVTYTADNDPGVASVSEIYRYYKDHGFPTVVMGASFRNADEIRALAGCDRLTISPDLLAELDDATGALPRMLEDTGASKTPGAAMTEAEFRWAMNQDAMATEKLAEGIRGFAAAHDDLVEIVRKLL